MVATHSLSITLYVVNVKETFYLFWKKIPAYTASTFLMHQVVVQIVERFIELIIIFQICKNQRTFISFTSITASIWSINKIILVSIVLMIHRYLLKVR